MDTRRINLLGLLAALAALLGSQVFMWSALLAQSSFPRATTWELTGEPIIGQTVRLQLAAADPRAASQSPPATATWEWGELTRNRCNSSDLSEADLIAPAATATTRPPAMDLTAPTGVPIACYWGQITYSGGRAAAPAVIILRWRTGNLFQDGLGSVGLGEQILRNTPGGAWGVFFFIPTMAALFSLALKNIYLTMGVFFLALLLSGFLVGFNIYFIGIFVAAAAVAAALVMALRGGLR